MGQDRGRRTTDCIIVGLRRRRLDGFRLVRTEKAKLLNAGLLFAWGAIHIIRQHNFGLFLTHPRQQNCS